MVMKVSFMLGISICNKDPIVPSVESWGNPRVSVDMVSPLEQTECWLVTLLNELAQC
jgi:hypothetical protein